MAMLPILPAGAAEGVRLGVRSKTPEAFAYEISVVRLALQHSGTDLPLELVPIPDMVQDRALEDLRTGRSRFNVYFVGFSPERERTLRQIDVPLTRGLLGHRVFATTEGRLPNFRGIAAVEQARNQVLIGSGLGWPDTDILRAAGLNLYASRPENLWTMLGGGRIDAIHRGLLEAFVELDVRRRTIPDLVLVPDVVLRYRFDYLLYLNKDDDALARILETGLRKAYANGAFMENFRTHPVVARALAASAGTRRVIIDLDNPLMTERQRAIPDEYWHDLGAEENVPIPWR